MSVFENNILAQQYENFFRYFQVGERFKYRERIEAMPAKNEISLYVDFDDLLNYDRKLAQDLLENPDTHIKEVSETLKRLITLYDNEYANKIGIFHVRFKGLPKENHIDIYNIREKHIGKLIAVEGVVSKINNVRYKIVEGVLKCPTCKEEFKVQPDEDGEIRTSGKCPNPDCKYNGRMILLKEKSRFMDIQSILIKPEIIMPERKSRNLRILLMEDLANIMKPEDRIIVVGIVRVGKSKTHGFYDIYIEANNIELKEKAIKDINF